MTVSIAYSIGFLSKVKCTTRLQHTKQMHIKQQICVFVFFSLQIKSANEVSCMESNRNHFQYNDTQAFP